MTMEGQRDNRTTGNPLLLNIFVFDGNEPLTFLCNTSDTTLADSLSSQIVRKGKGRERKDDTNLVFDTTSLHLVGNYLGAVLLGLGLVNELHQDTFVLVDITLGLLVEGVITRCGGEIPRNLGRTVLTGVCQFYRHLCTSLAVFGVPSAFSSTGPW